MLRLAIPVACVVLIFAAAGPPAVGQAPSDRAVPVGPDLAALGWRELSFDSIARTRFLGAADGTIRIEAERSSSFLVRPLGGVDLQATPCLAWRWRVTESTIPATDLSRRDGDDRPLMITVGFPFQSERASLWERVRYAFLQSVAEHAPPGHVLSWVWGGLGRRGDFVDSPHYGLAGRMQILRPGGTALRTWHEEAVDVAAAFEAAFGYRPPAPMEIAVSGDADGTGTASRGEITGLSFTARCPATQ